MKSNKKGLRRIISAFFYSADGLRSSFRYEEAFRQELFIFICLLPVIIFMPVTGSLKCGLFAANTLVLIVELLNTGVECIVDLVSPDYNKYAKRAKDAGSAAVLLSLLLALVVWVFAIISVL